MTALSPLPVTILTGFLGSGKTTLINHLLKNYPNEKIAIVENEFGAVGIDGGLLERRGDVEVIELTNGCVCCSVRGELTEALKKLLTQRDEGKLSFERLLLETTGLADPAPIIQTFFVDDVLRERLMLDAVITLVDAEHAQKQLSEHRVAVSQVGFADRLILTKLDRIDEETKRLLLERLRAINARAVVCEARSGRLEKEAWIGIEAFNLDEGFTLNATFTPSLKNSATPLRFRPLEQSDASRSWNDDITSHVFEAGDVDIKRIGAFMEGAIEKYGNDMLRYKGILAVAGEPRRLIVQGIHRVVGFDYGSEWRADEARKTMLVIIGRSLPIDSLEREFMSCVSQSEAYPR
ncbi:CobW family GTP-binding protein [Leminorella grimontii]|uniref:CobW family GTP-binding protein n=1 Tax=Leminorella grimontii TaxID=82981 RepID=UPI002082C79D|nr:GTP-binding protein [Leminorella grimontii]GKX60533.1 GTP-binding protein [Leminorella grimontii]